MENAKPVTQSQPVKARLYSFVSATVAIVLALLVAPSFMPVNAIWDPGSYGEIGLHLGEDSNAVEQVAPGSSAYIAGIRPGDTVGPPRTLRDRLILSSFLRIAPHPGERLTLSIFHRDQQRTLTLVARPMPPLSAADATVRAFKCVWALVFAAVGFVLVLLRPSRITWGFYLFALNVVLTFGPSSQYSLGPDLAVGLLVGYLIAYGFISTAGLAGFLIFCVRFPANTPTGWRMVIEGLAPWMAISYTWYYAIENAESIRFQFAPLSSSIYDWGSWAGFAVGAIFLLLTYLGAAGTERRQIKWIILAVVIASAAVALAHVTVGLNVGDGTLYAPFVVGSILLLLTYFGESGTEHRQTPWILLTFVLALVAAALENTTAGGFPVVSIFIVGAAAVLVTYSSAHGLERHRIKWVVFGFLCAIAATAVDMLWDKLSGHPAWYIGVLELLYMVLPLTVAYAVLRHRVIDVRFVLNRSLAVGAVLVIVALIVVGIDWLLSARLPNSRLEAALYVGAALFVGFSLNAMRQRIGKSIEFVFFRPWYRTRERAESIADGLRRASSKADLYEPLTAGIADAFSLASVALFERVEDGGFVRVAARGWPAGTIWHILPDDPLVVRASQSPRMVDLDVIRSHEPDLPAGVARPIAMLPIASGKALPAMLLCGAHANGVGLDSDELRAIRRLCTDAGLAYGISPFAQSLGNAFLDQRREPLGA